MITEVKGETAMKQLGVKLGASLIGGELIELGGDVGAGKTTLTKGLAVGMGVDETVQSPSFTISRVYDAPGGIQLAHYDFYRLKDAGIMANELSEMANDSTVVTVIEWAAIVADVLPLDKLQITITSPSVESRQVEMISSGPISARLLEKIA